MNVNETDNGCPQIAGGFKVAVAAVAIVLLALAGTSPIDWTPATVHDAAATAPVSSATAYFPSAYPSEAAELAPHVEAF